MEKQNMMGMLELILRPAFCVRHGSIVSANRQAQDRGIVIGASISGLLITGSNIPAKSASSLRRGMNPCSTALIRNANMTGRAVPCW